MPQAERFASPAACLVKDSEEEPVPQPLQASRIAWVSETVRIRGSFAGTFSAIARPRYGLPLLT